MSFDDFERKAEEHRPRAAVLVHIGGHIAFDVERIADYCRDHGIFLLEDCAHAHGARWDDRRAGAWGDAGAYSFYATKTISTGEGGMLVSAREELLEHARAFRNYGKPDHRVEGLNLRMSEFTAAIGVRADRAARRDRRPQERDRARAARPALLGAARAARRDDLRPLQVHRLRADRALDRQGLRGSLPPDHGDRRRAAQHRLGRREPLVRAALLRAGAGVGARFLPRRSRERSWSPAAPDSSARTWSTSSPRPASSRGSTTCAPRPTTSRARSTRWSATSSTPTRSGAAMEDCDAVVHLAAYADVGIVAEEPVERRGVQLPRDAGRAGGRARHRHPGDLRQHDLGLRRLGGRR